MVAVTSMMMKAPA
ncbi:hypothetical protein SUGI_0867520, partial [Cryptomeria japonica]